LFPESFVTLAHRHFDVQPLDLRPASATVPVRMVWHERRDADPAHRYLRERLAEVTTKLLRARGLPSGTPAPR